MTYGIIIGPQFLSLKFPDFESKVKLLKLFWVKHLIIQKQSKLGIGTYAYYIKTTWVWCAVWQYHWVWGGGASAEHAKYLSKVEFCQITRAWHGFDKMVQLLVKIHQDRPELC